MKKIDFLKQAIWAYAYRKKNWVFALVSKIQEDPEAYKQDSYPYRLVHTPTSVAFVDPNNDMQLTPIDDYNPKDFLFHFNDPIQIDPTWISNLNEPIATTVGRLLTNLVVLHDVFGNKIPYVNTKFSVSKIEAIIASRLKDTPEGTQERDPQFIYVDEYQQFVDRLQFIATLAPVCLWSATPTNIVKPPGIEAYRNQLIKEYGDKLHDPAYLAEFEEKLRDFDNEYLKDDPSNNKFMSGKIKNMARKKMQLTMGAEIGFHPSTQVNPILQSLNDGWSTEPDNFVSLMNGLRAGSYARGSETVNGGVTAKALLRSLGGFKVVQEDCGASLTLTRTFKKSDVDKLIGRYIKQQNKLILVDDQNVQQYLEQPVQLRSPIYCKSGPEQFCKYCIGEKIAINPEGLSLAVTSVSSVILASFMALMHGKQLSTAHYDFKIVLD